MPSERSSNGVCKSLTSVKMSRTSEVPRNDKTTCEFQRVHQKLAPGARAASLSVSVSVLARLMLQKYQWPVQILMLIACPCLSA